MLGPFRHLHLLHQEHLFKCIENLKLNNYLLLFTFILTVSSKKETHFLSKNKEFFICEVFLLSRISNHVIYNE